MKATLSRHIPDPEMGSIDVVESSWRTMLAGKTLTRSQQRAGEEAFPTTYQVRRKVGALVGGYWETLATFSTLEKAQVFATESALNLVVTKRNSDHFPCS